MRQRVNHLEVLGLLASGFLLVAWFLWATIMTSSDFALVSGSEVLAKVARHPAQYRWGFGGLLVALTLAAQGWLWLETRRLAAVGLLGRCAASIALLMGAIVAIGTLNWSVFYDPLDVAIKSAWGGIVLDSVALPTSEDGPCTTDVELRGGRLHVQGRSFHLNWWPLPLEDARLMQFLSQSRCP
jgi:hypothetical protein